MTTPAKKAVCIEESSILNALLQTQTKGGGLVWRLGVSVMRARVWAGGGEEAKVQRMKPKFQESDSLGYLIKL
eukprot:scaffold78081_cov12-Tisochrysis_lutea.AAC.1